VLVEPGPFVADGGRQSEMKAEALAEAAAPWNPVLGLTGRDAVLGPAVIASMARLCRGALVATHLAQPERIGAVRWHAAAGRLFGSFDPEPELFSEIEPAPIPLSEAMDAFLAEAERRGLSSAAMVRAGEAEARSIARRWPKLGLIIFIDEAAPGSERLKQGAVEMAAAGSRGRSLISISADGARNPILLGPQLADDPDAGAIYARYLRRVADGGLLEALPRSRSGAYAGSRACFSCHPSEAKAWKESAHASALATLEGSGHDRDPDCVSCHVVGLESAQGFRSRSATPDLADVGCESCHGPGAAHAEAPEKSPMGRIGSASCALCHNADHSPGFDFSTYWPQISHGLSPARE
jgi:hypothetical protein